jgi:hypothetical protein
MINEHDMTKKMMDTIRTQKKLLRENMGNSDGVIELSGDERKAEEDKFRETVDSSAQISVFNIYPDANNVVFGGTIQGMGGLEFQFTLEDTNGFYITTNNLQITDEIARKLTTMKGYYDNWRDEWFQKLATEYRR